MQSPDTVRAVWSLLDLLATGAIGPVAPGSTADTVTEAFGPPAEVSKGPPTILKYDALEVTVSSGLIDLVHIEFHESLPPFIRDDGLSGRSTRDDVESLLADRGMLYEPYPPLTFDGRQSALVVSRSSVIVVFAESDRLAAISSSSARGA